MKPELRFSFVFNLFVLCFVVLALPTISFGQQDENQRDKVNVPYPNLTKSTSSAINVQNYTGTNVTNPLHPNKLVTDLLVTGCIQASNVIFRGDREQIGRFDRALDNPNFPLESGIVLSTGKATDAIGPNGSSSRSSEYSLTGELDLQALAGVSSSRVSDPAVLTFDFVPNGTVVEFRYIFASDEYPEWACSQYNDVFGFFISGPGLSGSYQNGALNIAKLPDNSPVSINNIHVGGWDNANQSSPNPNTCPDKNAAYYVSVPSGSTTIEYDGRTTVLTARIEGLQACGTYKMKIALADINDKQYDSAVFLEAKSLGASGAVIKNFYNLVESDDVFQGCSPNEVRFYREAGSNNTLPQTINYVIEGTAVSGVHHNLTSGTVVIPANQDYVALSYELPVVALDATKTIIVKADVSCLCSGGSQWVEKAIRIHDPFVLKTFSTTPQTHCNQANGSLTVMAGPGASSYDYVFTYRLYNSSNQLLSTQSTGANINLTFPNLGSDSYTIRITEEKSCHEIVQSGIIVQSPNAPTLSLSSNSPVCAGETIELNASSSTAGLTYSWSGPAGFSSNIANPVVNNAGVANAGTYSLMVTAPNNCTATRGINVAVNALPEVSITANGSLQFCEGGSVTLTASAGASYLWSNGAVSQSIEVTEAGNYSVQVTNSNGCSNTAEVAVIVNELPVVEITTSGPTTICEGGSVTLTASEGASYLWSNGAVSQSIEVTEAGEYNVEVTDANGCSNTANETVTVTVNPLPTVSVVEDYAVCHGTSITLNAAYANGELSWNNGVENNVPFVITETTTFTATVTGECGTASESVTVTVNPLPTVSVVEDFAVCHGTSITLDAIYANGELSWSNGIENNVPFVITETTTFTATVTGECGTASESVTVTVNPLPTVSVVEDFAVCHGTSITLNAAYANGELSWDNGVENNVPFVITETTTFTATVTGECGKASESVTVTVNPLPTVSVVEDFAVCHGTSITLNAVYANGELSWNNGVENNVPFVITETTTFTATVTGECGTASESVTVTVNPLPTVSVVEDFAVCHGSSITLNAEYANGELSWDNGVENNVPFVITETTTFTATVTGECGTASESVAVTVNPLPTVSVVEDYAVCHGTSITLNAEYANGELSWSNGIENNVPFVITETTTFTATVTGECGTASESVTVTVNPLPTVSVVEDYAVCHGTSITLNAEYANGDLSWSNGVENNVPFVITETTTFTATVTGECGTASESVTVTVNPLPTVSVVEDYAVCHGTSITLNAEYANGELSWDNGVENNVPFVITETTTFTATVTGECGTVSESVTVTVNPLPIVSCPENITIGELANPITLGGATPEGGIYEGTGIENGIFNPAIAGVGTHEITYTYQSEEGCINVCEFEINVISMPNFSCIPSFAVCGNDEAFEIEQPSYAGGTYSGQGVENNIFDPQSVEAGIYDIHYTYVDEFGYVYGCDFTITVNAAPEVILNAFAPICSGDEAIVLTGGLPEGGIYSGTGVENGIFNPAIAGVGIHEITYTYTDANGCSDNATAQIEVLESLCFDVEVENVSCFGEEDGSIKVIFTCGPPVQVCVDVIGGDKCAPGNKTGFAFFGGLAPGTYVIYFTAPNGCVSTQTVVITQPDEIVINIEEVSPMCSNAAPVALIATPEGGIFTGAGVEGNLFNPEMAVVGDNVITYTYTDAYGCIGSSDLIITVLEAPVVTIEPIGPFCEDGAIVNLVGTPEGGVFSGNGVSGNTFDPSAAQLGENTVTYIYESENGCIGEASIGVSVYPRIDVTLNDFAPVCSNEEAFALTGGYPEGGVYSGVGVVDGMFDPSISGAGIFEITYTYDDPNGCGGFATSTIEVYQTVCVEVTHTDVTCFGEDNGTITVNITCGTAVNICLDVEEGQNCKTVGKASNVFYGGLAPGNYIVYVTDVNGCLVSVPVTIAEPEELVVQVEGTNPLCNGQVGSAVVTVTGGTGTYSFDWGGADPNALFAGDYQVVVTDENGCSAIGNVTITEPQELLVNVDVHEMTCSNANDAVVTVTVEGGTPDYEICMIHVGQGTDCLEGQIITEPMVGMTFPGLQPGVYSLSVIDANGCSYEQEITINAIDELVAEVVVNQPACFGETGSAVINVVGGTEPYTIHAEGLDLNALTDGTYEVMITDAHDCFTTVSITIVSPEELVANPVVTNVSCHGGNNGSVVLNVSGGSGEYTYELFGLDLNNLAAGDYMIVVYDANNCSLPVSFVIEEPEMLTLSLQADEILCHGETTNITSQVSGGIAPYTYAWNNGSVSADLENVGGGEYALTVVDANGCQKESSITVIEPEELVLTAEIFHPEAFGEDNGAIETVVTGGTQPYQYLWSNGSTTPSLYGLVAGTYNVSVTDANNCMAFGEYTLVDPELVIDLSVVKTVNYAVADSGRVITFTVVLTNNHPFATAQNVVLNDVMDDVFEYQSHSVSMGSFDASSFVWNIPALAAQTSATLTIDAVIHGCGVNNICIVSSSVPDPDMSNNCSSVGACIKESSGGGGGGIESNGNMASKISLRNYRNTVSGNFIEKAARRSQQSKFAMADVITGQLKSASINQQSVSGITQFIPEEGPANTEAFVTTPADLIGITNANEIFSVDYLQSDNSRRATVLAMVTDPGVVYDHTKVICDRLAGARLEKGSYVNIKGRQFIMSQLVHQNGEVDFAVSFVAFRDNNTFVVDNQWINEDYSTSGNDDVFNFQVWSVTPQYTISLVEEILDGMKNAGTLQFVDNNPVMPELYVREGYYRNGTMHLTVVNKSTSRKMTVKGSKADVEDGSRKQFQMQIDLPEGEVIDVEVPVGYVFDAGFTLKGDQSIGRDMLYFADGAWGFDYEEFGAFVSDFNTQAVEEASPEYAYGVERNAQISGRVTTYASLYRSLNTHRLGENLSDYDELAFTANGKGRVEVILAKDGIHNWSEQYRQVIELSSSNETYTLKFNDFTNKSGQKGFSPEDVKTIIFNVLGNGSASSDFEMNVSNVYFGNSLESASGDGIFIPVYPNPFTRSANIEFGVTRDTQVKVEVLNIYGQVVDVIANESMTQGYYKLTWTPVDDKSGVYLIRVSIGNDTYTSKVVYQK